MTPCAECGTHAPAVRRGLSALEILGTCFLVLATCGLGFPLLIGLPILASRQVCPACKAPR